MKNKRSVLFMCLMATSLLTVAAGTKNEAESSWVHLDKRGRLVYQQTPRGDRIVDFSHAGYMGGGVPLPEVEVVKRVKYEPGLDDYTETIQKAIDEVSVMPIRNGFRGAVLLAPGEYRCSGSLVIAADGVVVRGSGDRAHKSTTIVMCGEKHSAFVMSRQRRTPRLPDAQLVRNGVKVTDAYVPCGTRSLHVANGSGFRPGDDVLICKPVTKDWLHFMRMDDLWRNGKPQTWIAEGTWLKTRRTLQAVDGDRLTFTVPLVDAYDMRYTNDSTLVVAAPHDSLLTQAGVENLRISSPSQAVNHTVAKYFGVRLNGRDCWLKDLDLFETMESIGTNGERITLKNVSVMRTARHEGSSKPAEFPPNAGQILMDHCYVKGDNIWSVGIGARVSGPIVLLNCKFEGNGRFQGHQRWSTAFLLDNCSFEEGGIDFMNRGEMGSGHGWGTAWAVAWNCTAKDYVNQLPPGSCNWGIGCHGKRLLQRRPFSKSGPFEPEGIYDSHGQSVTPQSLYLTQLKERLGQQALRNIGY